MQQDMKRPTVGLSQDNTKFLKIVKDGTNLNSVRVFKILQNRGFTGLPEQMRLEFAENKFEPIPLAGLWKFKVEFARDASKLPPRLQPLIKNWKPKGLFNAMVAPLIPYTITGAIWYQGE